MLGQLNTASKLATLVTTVAKTATFSEGARVDIRGFNDALLVFSIGAITGTTPTLSLQIEHGDASDGSDATNITGAVEASWTTVVPQVAHLNLRGLKRYLSCTGTVGGTTPSFLIGVHVILYNPTDSADSGSMAFDV